MEDDKQYTSASDLVNLPPLARPRHVPDVPEDVDFIMEHLNDPNFDLRKSSHSLKGATVESFELDQKHQIPTFTAGYAARSDVDAESQLGSDRFSTSRAESRNSTNIDFDDESPYPEVRAAVPSIDDPTMPVNTLRMWVIGVFFTILVSGLNQTFALRYPSVLVTGIVIQLIALPVGKGFERVLPRKKIRVFGYVMSLNPGPFNIKEHVCVTVMANVSVAGAYATDVIATQRFFYNQELSYGYQILLTLGSQVFGFSMGGILRQFIVWPSSMIWPGALVNSALFNTLHRNYGKRDRGHMSREKFFCIVLACSFFWYWIPGYLFTALSVFNWICWIAPNNVAVNALFGTSSGLGMGVFTFDWAMISYISSPLVTPWWSEMNTVAALIIVFWVVTPILYFTNACSFAFLPISAYVSFDNTGLPYDVSAIITDGVFDGEKYQAYSPVFVSATLAMAYGLAFAAFSSVIVHTFLWFRKDLVRRFRSTLKDERDVHSRLMQAYSEVPNWWYGLVGVVSIIFLLVSVEIFDTQMPIWGVVLALFLASALSIPVGMIQAITNQQITLQVMHELIAGYILPGRPVANMIFKCVAFIGTNQAVGFAGDLKLGHYMKIPPRMMFMVQVVAAVVSSFVVISVQQWMFNNIVDICLPTQTANFICPSTNTFGTASIIWGGVGPRRLFSAGGMYNPFMWMFLIGAVAPVPFYFLSRRYPMSFWRYINIPVFFAGIGGMPPASGINYASWAIVGFIFNYCIRRYHFRWWMRYNYILSAGLDAGVALGVIIIFWTLAYPRGGINLSWWGNTVWMNTADALGTPFKLPSGPTFGPTTWS